VLTLSALAFTTLIAVQEPPPTTQSAPRTPAEQGQPQNPRTRERSRQEQTFNVTRGTRIDLLDCTGDVIVRPWTRDVVQLRSDSRRTEVKGTLNEKVLVITASLSTASASGQRSYDRDIDTIDYELMVPAWIDLHIEGRECGMAIDGVTGNVIVKNIEGDITMRGVGGSIDASSIEGGIDIVGGKGRIKASSSDADIKIAMASGDIEVDSLDGEIEILDVTSANVIATNVDGDITFRGPLQATGKYRFQCHDGDVVLVIPPDTNGSFTIRRYEGELHTTFPLKPTGEVRSGRRTTYTLGTGSGPQVEIETFDGDVYIKKPGEKTGGQ